jgi:hypothetical protein
VIDDRFDGLSNVRRDALVAPLLKDLPDDVQADITILLLLTPEETDESMMNLELERPSPSRL